MKSGVPPIPDCTHPVRDPRWWLQDVSTLSRSIFARADLDGTNLARAVLRGAYFGPERILRRQIDSGRI